MGYLITKDYQRIIQSSELAAITGNDVSIRKLAEGTAQAKCMSYLVQKYDISQEFRDINVFSMGVIYKALDRVYLDATAYSATATYVLNDLVLQAGKVYVCTTAIPVAEAFTIGKWALLGDQYDLFFVTLPAPMFDYLKVYAKTNPVFWKDKTYIAQRDSILMDQQSALDAIDIQNISRGNVFPDNAINGPEMWGAGTPFSVAAGTRPTDATKWTKGDCRDQQFVSLLMDIVVYDLCKRIAPQNVPEIRHNAWVAATDTMKKFAKGEITASLPLLQPKSGNRMRHGGNAREINSW
jgi:hypothetical protein